MPLKLDRPLSDFLLPVPFIIHYIFIFGGDERPRHERLERIGKIDIKYSVIIPTYNRARLLVRCLSCIENLKVSSKSSWEALVIDNNSTDETKKVVDSFKNRICNLRYFFVETPGLHAARHFGCKKAQGNILCYIDDDSFVTKRWLQGIEKAFFDPKLVLVGGPCLPEYEIEPPMWLSQFWGNTNWGKCLASLSLLDFGEQVKSISPYYVFGCNFNIRKDILLKVGGFHPDAMPKELIRFRGDGETSVSRKLIDMGRNALYCPDVKIYHLVPASRMTKEYFCHRAYIQGISGSFMQIRKEHGVDGGDKDAKNESVPRKALRIIWRKLRGVKNRILPNEDREMRKIREKIRKCHKKGFAFHQQAVKDDPKLLNWVLRENYLGENGKLLE